ncbi:YggT family protein [Pseudaquidulcibacter saccharophilus]|uniref:YggT family protein n=1 Tax=Pseudaquidulcibacter saccharophilus TaxID=2831900 RepID=UPI001EFF11F7|nr:YggT family protein [Pseudaquidulcibacter saccharophilus]
MQPPIQWLVSNILGLYWYVILIDVILSWLIAFDVVNTRNKFIGTIADVTNRLTAPVLNPLRRIIPPVGGLDLSPLVLIFGMRFLQIYVVPLIPI